MELNLPPIGLGTWNNTDEQECVESVTTALELGYRHLDTAQLYGTEECVGTGIREAEVDREAITVASKLDPEKLASENVLASTRASRERIGVDAIDIMYVHWPRAAYDPAETLPALDRLIEEDVVRATGVSNFSPELWEEARETADHPVMVNQIELHPLLQQDALQRYARDNGLTLVAYAPLARGEVFEVPELLDIAAAHDATAAQVALAWLHNKDNVVPIPKARGPHIEENFEALRLDLSQAELQRIDDIDRTLRLVDPPSAPWNRA